MCGIAGFASPGGDAPRAYPRLLSAISQALIHRGPDEAGQWVGDGVGLAIRRLSIIDLAGGHQPLGNEDGTVQIVMNGEIFNHLELRSTLEALGHQFKTHADTEAVVHAYEQWGDACVERLNGQFAFAIWDRRRRRLFAARDRVGIKPLYYRHQAGTLWFASELKALLRLPFVETTVDLEALRHFLVLEYVPSPLSIIQGIGKLPAGHWMRWDSDSGSLEVRQYWDVNLRASEARPAQGKIQARVGQLLERLEAAVRREMIADVPVGVFLSGGIDSGAVAAMMVRASPDRVQSFSIGFRDRSFDESSHARQVAAYLGTSHHELILEPEMLPSVLPHLREALDEPFADASIIPTYLLSRFAREHVKVALGGDGGDELFAGYPTLQAHRLALWYRHAPPPLRAGIAAAVRHLPVSHDNFSLDFRAKRFVRGIDDPTALRHLGWMGAFEPQALASLLTGEALNGAGALAVPEQHAARAGLGDPLNQVLYLDMKLYLEGDILTKLDRATMMASLEGRVPLLNAEFVDYVASIPVDDKLHGLGSKYLLKQALRGVLPDDILHRAKKGFGIPLARWLRGPLREELMDELAPGRLQQDGFFQQAAVQRLIDEHMQGVADHRKALWALFTFQRWQAEYASRPKVEKQAA